MGTQRTWLEDEVAGGELLVALGGQTMRGTEEAGPDAATALPRAGADGVGDPHAALARRVLAKVRTGRPLQEVLREAGYDPGVTRRWLAQVQAHLHRQRNPVLVLVPVREGEGSRHQPAGRRAQEGRRQAQWTEGQLELRLAG